MNWRVHCNFLNNVSICCHTACGNFMSSSLTSIRGMLEVIWCRLMASYCSLKYHTADLFHWVGMLQISQQSMHPQRMYHVHAASRTAEYRMGYYYKPDTVKSCTVVCRDDFEVFLVECRNGSLHREWSPVSVLFFIPTSTPIKKLCVKNWYRT